MEGDTQSACVLLQKTAPVDTSAVVTETSNVFLLPRKSRSRILGEEDYRTDFFRLLSSSTSEYC